jgi:hypothetical protein
MLSCCCNSSPPPPPPCTITVAVYQRNTASFGMTGEGGTPISGATVTVSGGMTASGTTNSSGLYTFTIGAGISATLTVSYGGCSYTQAISPGSCGTINLCFCSFTTTLVVAGPGSGISVTMSGLAIPSYDPFVIDVNNGDSTPIGVCSVSGSTYTFTFCSLDLCSNPLYLPAGVAFAASAAGWVTACSPQFNPTCGVNNTFDVTLYYWVTCYHDYLSGPAPDGAFPYANGYWACCTPPCVPVATPDGYYPKTIEVRWHSINNPYSFTSCNVFGPDENQWITLNLTSDVVTAPGAYSTRTLTWTSGCRPGGAYYGTNTELPLLNYASSSVVLTVQCFSRYPGIGGLTATLAYQKWHLAGCVPYTGSEPPFDCVTYAGQDSFEGSILPLPGNVACSPVDASYLGADYLCSSVGCSFTVDLIEPSCEPAQSPVVTAPTGGGS